MGEGATMTQEPLVKTVEVPLDPGAAFELFTEGIARWWPLRTHSVGEDRAAAVVFESGVGGRIYETVDDGAEHEWGRVLEWDPPARVLYTWYPGRDETTAQKIEVTFIASGGGTQVQLVHTGWETLGDLAAAQRTNYDTGWDFTLGHYRSVAAELD